MTLSRIGKFHLKQVDTSEHNVRTSGTIPMELQQLHNRDSLCQLKNVIRRTKKGIKISNFPQNECYGMIRAQGCANVRSRKVT
jgi:hypothetical protein